MNSLEYWRKREQAQREKRIADEEERNRRIAQIYAEMQDAVQKQIDAFYGKYARAEGISIAEAKKRAAQLDIDAYARKAKKYVKEKDFTDKANAEMKLYNMTMKVNRLELLKAEIGSELCAGFSDIEKEFDGDLLSDAIGEMQRQSGILGTTISDQAKRARGLVDASFHNATFSDRIWMYQDMLKNELATLLQEGLIQGRNSKELARHLTKLFGVSEHDSERLMRTEMTRVYTAAQHESLTEAGYDQYTFIAEPTACDVCLALDGQRFPVEDLEDIGNHAPPIHPNCRCSVAAYMDREEFGRWLDDNQDERTQNAQQEYRHNSTKADLETNAKSYGMNYGQILKGETRELSISSRTDATVESCTRVEFEGKNVYISNRFTESPEAIMDKLEPHIKNALDIVGRDTGEIPDFIVADAYEVNDVFGRYLYDSNTVILVPRLFGDLDQIDAHNAHLALHELLHWSDCQNLAKEYPGITEEKLVPIMNEWAKERLDEVGVDDYSIIYESEYANAAFEEKKYFEVYVEHRVRMLGF